MQSVCAGGKSPLLYCVANRARPLLADGEANMERLKTWDQEVMRHERDMLQKVKTLSDYCKQPDVCRAIGNLRAHALRSALDADAAVSQCIVALTHTRT